MKVYVSYLNRTWCIWRAKEVKRDAKAKTSPPITAMSLVLPRRHAPTTRGAEPRDTAALKAPTQAETLIWLLLSGTRVNLLSVHFGLSFYMNFISPRQTEPNHIMWSLSKTLNSHNILQLDFLQQHIYLLFTNPKTLSFNLLN